MANYAIKMSLSCFALSHVCFLSSHTITARAWYTQFGHNWTTECQYYGPARNYLSVSSCIIFPFYSVYMYIYTSEPFSHADNMPLHI